MPPRRILVTGAGGFVGRHLLPALRAAFPDAELHTAPFEITDATAIDEAIHSAQPDALVHLAAVAAISAARLDPGHAWQVNLTGTLNIARALLHRAPDCTLLFVSSADIYGASFRAGVLLNEAALPASFNAYAATKAAADLALGAMAAEGLRVIRMRPFNHTGPGQAPAFVVAAFAEQVARVAAGHQALILRVGALDAMRDFLDVRDVCSAYAACLARSDTLLGGHGAEPRVGPTAPGRRHPGRADGCGRRCGGGRDRSRPLAPNRHPHSSRQRGLGSAAFELGAGDRLGADHRRRARRSAGACWRQIDSYTKRRKIIIQFVLR